MTNDQLNATFSAVAKQAQALPSNAREQAEDSQLTHMYETGQISAQDLNSLLTEATDKNPQEDPGKAAVDQLTAQGVKLTSQQKDAVEQSARSQASQAKLAQAQNLLDMERSAPGQDPSQALSIGVQVYGADGKKQDLMVRNTGPGQTSIQQISDLGDGFKDQAMIDAAEDQLAAQMASTPADQRKNLSQKVHTPGGTYDVSLATSGQFSVKKEEGFWGSLGHFLEGALKAVAPIALAAIPVVGAAAAAAYEGVKGGIDIANGNVLGGIADFAGAAGGIGADIGGDVGSTVQDTAKLVQYGDQAAGAAASGNVLGALDSAVGAVPGIDDLAGDLGAPDGFGDTADAVADGVGTATGLASKGLTAANAIESGNLFTGISGFAGLAPDALGLFGDGGAGLAAQIRPVLNEAAGLGEAGQNAVDAITRGNYAEGIADLAALGGNGSFLASQLSPLMTEAASLARLGGNIQSTVAAAQEGNVAAALSRAAAAARMGLDPEE